MKSHYRSTVRLYDELDLTSLRVLAHKLFDD